MAMRIESLAEELAKPGTRGCARCSTRWKVALSSSTAWVCALGTMLDEMDEWIGRAGEAERTVDAARRRLA